MNKVLHKKITKSSETKFARWKALFANFYFHIEHIKSSENSILDFLSRENLQVSVKTSERGQENVDTKQERSNGKIHCLVIVTKCKNGGEEIRNIPDNEDWEVYAQLWKPTWKLRRTEVLDMNLQAIHLLPNYVPELIRIPFILEIFQTCFMTDRPEL
jgi:hypothetical protein